MDMTNGCVIKRRSMKEKLKKDMAKRKMTQKEYADLFRVEQSTISRILSGDRPASKQFQMLMKLGTKTLKRIRVK